ncbi:MAG: YeeE/YedE family protein [Oxalobacter sp.]|nr:MAG: YeeE/YedE family protein [Oxalobacter sp.]
MHFIFSFLGGLLFGIGLIVAGMANPQKVLSFLDLVGHWDPSLALVMGGAIPVSAIAFYWAKKRTLFFLGYAIQLPTIHNLDKRLAIGGALFGIGWGLAGICPGPALVLLGAGVWKALVFLIAMFVGMMLFERFANK